MSLTTKRQTANVLYLTIAQGRMVEKSTEDNPEAVKREYTTKDGKTGVKYEIQHANLTGHIIGLDFRDTEFGEQFVITITAGGEQAKLSMPTDSNYFTDFAKRLPGIDLDREVTLNPYELEKDNGKTAKGISVKQGNEKIMNAYWDGKKATNGMPSVSKKDAKEYDSDDWKMYFMKVKKFLKTEVQGIKLPDPALVSDIQVPTKEEAEQVMADDYEVGDDDLPF